MELHFRNQTSYRLWVAVMFYSPETCGALGNWRAQGWWAIEPGGETHPLNTNNRYAAFYAESEIGHRWGGHYGPVYVHQEVFDWCYTIGDNNPNTRIVGMEQVYLPDPVNYHTLVHSD